MENLSPEILIAINVLITGLIAGISKLISSRKKNKKDEITLLHEEIERLQKYNKELCEENEGWRKKYDKMFIVVLEGKERILSLEALLEKNDVEFPIIVKEVKNDIIKTTSDNWY